MENLSTRLLHSTQGTIFRAFVLCNGIYSNRTLSFCQAFTFPDILVECDLSMGRNQTKHFDLPSVQDSLSSDLIFLYDFLCERLQYVLDVLMNPSQSYNEREVLHMCDHSCISNHQQLVLVSHLGLNGTCHLHNDGQSVS